MRGIKEAPEIAFDRDKMDFNDASSSGFALVPNTILMKMMEKINSFPEFRLLLFFISCAPGFRVPFATVQKRAYIADHNNYRRAKKSLIDKGFLKEEDGKITVLLEKLMK